MDSRRCLCFVRQATQFTVTRKHTGLFTPFYGNRSIQIFSLPFWCNRIDFLKNVIVMSFFPLQKNSQRISQVWDRNAALGSCKLAIRLRGMEKGAMVLPNVPMPRSMAKGSFLSVRPSETAVVGFFIHASNAHQNRLQVSESGYLVITVQKYDPAKVQQYAASGQETRSGAKLQFIYWTTKTRLMARIETTTCWEQATIFFEILLMFCRQGQ